MDHPLSHTSAVVAGVSFIFVAGSLASFLSNSAMLLSPTWWSVLLLAGSVMSVSIIGYVRPRSLAIYLPIFVASLILLGLCCWQIGFSLCRGGTRDVAFVVLRSVGFFYLWFVWTRLKLNQLRVSRHGD